jgi:lipid-binding SYLF domain-containing protein
MTTIRKLSLVAAHVVLPRAARAEATLEKTSKATGKTTMAQATIGAQGGGQTYYQAIFFETKEALAAFKKGERTMAAQASAVAIKSGASADARYADGVAVSTLTRAGAMAEASVGGQKFTYTPLGAKQK